MMGNNPTCFLPKIRSQLLFCHFVCMQIFCYDQQVKTFQEQLKQAQKYQIGLRLKRGFNAKCNLNAGIFFGLIYILMHYIILWHILLFIHAISKNRVISIRKSV